MALLILDERSSSPVTVGQVHVAANMHQTKLMERDGTHTN